MAAHGHTTVWGTHTGVSRGSDAKRWSQQLQAWWAARKAVRHDAKLAALTADWDTGREAVRPLRAEAAIDLVASTHARSTMTALCDLGA